LECYDRERNILVECSKGQEVKQFFAERLPSSLYESLFRSVELSQVEAIVEEPQPLAYMKLCSIITRVEGTIALVWVVKAVIEEYVKPEDAIPEYINRTSEERFYRTIAFLEELSKQLLNLKEQELLAEEAMALSKESEEKYKMQMYRSEAMTSVVRLLGSEDAFSKLADEIIQEVCRVLDIEGGCLLRENADRKHVDVLCEYSALRNWNLGNRLDGQAKQTVPFFDGKPYMISSDSMMPEKMEQFPRSGIASVQFWDLHQDDFHADTGDKSSHHRLGDVPDDFSRPENIQNDQPAGCHQSDHGNDLHRCRTAVFHGQFCQDPSYQRRRCGIHAEHIVP
jgi:hypothetical protein